MTGATGFIGKNFVEEFFAKDIPCKCLVRTGSVPAFEFFIAELETKYEKRNACIEIVEGSLLEPEFFKTSLCEAEAIIHCASVVYAVSFEAFHMVNIVATEVILNFVKEYEIRKFIYLSSAAVLFPQEGYYVASKRIAEERIAEQLANTTVDYLILRPTLVTGPYDKKNIAQIIQIMLHYRVALMVGRGKYEIQPLYVKDVVNVTMKFLRQNEPTRQAITLAPDECMQYRDFLLEIGNAIKRKTGKRTVILSIPFPLMRWGVRLISRIFRGSNITLETLERILNHTRIENHEAKRLFGFTPTSLTSGLAQSIDFFVARKKGIDPF